MKIGDTVTLEGATMKGRNRVREHGKDWRVVRLSDRVQALGNRPGVWLVSVADAAGRWIDAVDDRDFRVSGEVKVMVQIEVRDGVEFQVWWHYERSGRSMYAAGGYIVCRECGVRLGERTSVALVESAMRMHARAGSMFSCRGRKEGAA